MYFRYNESKILSFKILKMLILNGNLLICNFLFGQMLTKHRFHKLSQKKSVAICEICIL